MGGLAIHIPENLPKSQQFLPDGAKNWYYFRYTVNGKNYC